MQKYLVIKKKSKIRIRIRTYEYVQIRFSMLATYLYGNTLMLGHILQKRSHTFQICCIFKNVLLYFKKLYVSVSSPLRPKSTENRSQWNTKRFEVQISNSLVLE